jgi:hypothetical protein
VDRLPTAVETMDVLTAMLFDKGVCGRNGAVRFTGLPCCVDSLRGMITYFVTKLSATENLSGGLHSTCNTYSLSSVPTLTIGVNVLYFNMQQFALIHHYNQQNFSAPYDVHMDQM